MEHHHVSWENPPFLWPIFNYKLVLPSEVHGKVGPSGPSGHAAWAHLADRLNEPWLSHFGGEHGDFHRKTIGKP